MLKLTDRVIAIVSDLGVAGREPEGPTRPHILIARIIFRQTLDKSRAADDTAEAVDESTVAEGEQPDGADDEAETAHQEASAVIPDEEETPIDLDEHGTLEDAEADTDVDASNKDSSSKPDKGAVDSKDTSTGTTKADTAETEPEKKP